MSTPIRNLWPDDITFEEVISPEEILNHQAQLLGEKTSGRLVGHVEKLTGQDRIVLAFEVEAPQVESRIRLFEVQHRLEFDYPARIFPPEALPDFLKDRVYHPGMFEAASAPSSAGKWVKREWVASSPTEFSDKIEEVLDGASVKALVLSLLSRSRRKDESNDAPTNDS